MSTRSPDTCSLRECQLPAVEHIVASMRVCALHRRTFTRRHQAPCWVYFAQVGGYIKIGRSANVPSRLRRICYEPSAPKDLPRGRPLLLAVFLGSASDEALVHFQFYRARVTGEWFKASDELLEFIAEIPPVFTDSLVAS